MNKNLLLSGRHLNESLKWGLLWFLRENGLQLPTVTELEFNQAIRSLALQLTAEAIGAEEHRRAWQNTLRIILPWYLAPHEWAEDRASKLSELIYINVIDDTVASIADIVSEDVNSADQLWTCQYTPIGDLLLSYVGAKVKATPRQDFIGTKWVDVKQAIPLQRTGPTAEQLYAERILTVDTPIFNEEELKSSGFTIGEFMSVLDARLNSERKHKLDRFSRLVASRIRLDLEPPKVKLKEKLVVDATVTNVSTDSRCVFCYSGYAKYDKSKIKELVIGPPTTVAIGPLAMKKKVADGANAKLTGVEKAHVAKVNKFLEKHVDINVIELSIDDPRIQW